MTSSKLGLLDTSVLVAFEAARPLNQDLLPDSLVISVVTLAELRAGVLAASDVAVQARRISTLERAQRIAQLPVDQHVAAAWAVMRVQIGRAGRRVNSNDLWIAATAAVHELPVYTQDEDFDAIAAIGGVTVIMV